MTHDLKQIYLAELERMVAADELSLAVTKDMEEAADHSQLSEGLENAVCGISDGLDIVRELLEKHGGDTDGSDAPGMKALAQEARAAALNSEFADPAAQDAAILLHFQRFTHYGLTSYDILARMARALGLDEDAEKLGECHANAQDGDDDMGEVADSLLASLPG